MTQRHVLGIDIGGSGIKGALVDLKKGEMATDRIRIPTPAESTPKNVAQVVKQIVEAFAEDLADGPVGITIPAVVTHGVTRSAANIDKSWIDAPAERIFEDVLGRDIYLMNDADAAGVAEVQYGAAKGHPGLVLVTTLGTGIGTAIINRGVLVPNANWATSRSTARTPSRRPQPAPASARSCRSRSGRRGCRSTTAAWSSTCGPT